MTARFCFPIQYTAKSRCVKARGRVASDIHGAGDGGSTQASASWHMRQVGDRVGEPQQRAVVGHGAWSICSLLWAVIGYWMLPLWNVKAKRSEAANAKAATKAPMND